MKGSPENNSGLLFCYYTFTNMETKIHKLKNFRLFLLDQIKNLNEVQLNKVPPGFNNNIIWNLGHMICVQQNMSYVRARRPVIVDDKYFTPYLPHTRPESFVQEADIKMLSELFISTIDALQNDLDKNMFDHYTPSALIPEIYGFDVKNIDSALEYLLHHDGYHAGYINSLMRFI